MMQNQTNQIHQLQLVSKSVKKAMQSVLALPGMREATTGRLVSVPGESRPPRLVVLPRVHAVAAAEAAAPAEVAPGRAARPRPELAFYRKYTEALLRRYLRTAIEVGRVPSVMSREMFRGNVTHYKRNTLEDGVIFCHDVERVLEHLDDVERLLIRRITLQNYSHTEVAGMVGLSLRGCGMRYAQTLDRLTKLFLERRLLLPLVDPGLRQALRSGPAPIVVKGGKPVPASQVFVITEVTSQK